jgi:type II secretory pathway component GspD/PulD (secretin)
MLRVSIVLFALFMCQGQVSAQTCIQKYKQSNGITAYGQANCSPNSNASPSEQAQQKSPAQASAAFFGGVGQRVNLNFQNIEITSLMQVFSDISNKRFYVDEAVVGATDIVSENTPWTEALAKMLFRNQLAVVKIRSGFYVCPASMSDEVCTKRAATKGL